MIRLLARVAVACVCGSAVADEAPTPAPSTAAIKACVQQIDMGNHWRFVWKSVLIGTARHPRNRYEALYAPPGPAWNNAYGYPVHVVYSVNDRPDIDTDYWLIRDPGGHWQIPAVCTMR